MWLQSTNSSSTFLLTRNKVQTSFWPFQMTKLTSTVQCGLPKTIVSHMCVHIGSGCATTRKEGRNVQQIFSIYLQQYHRHYFIILTSITQNAKLHGPGRGRAGERDPEPRFQASEIPGSPAVPYPCWSRGLTPPTGCLKHSTLHNPHSRTTPGFSHMALWRQVWPSTFVQDVPAYRGHQCVLTTTVVDMCLCWHWALPYTCPEFCHWKVPPHQTLTLTPTVKEPLSSLVAMVPFPRCRAVIQFLCPSASDSAFATSLPSLLWAGTWGPWIWDLELLLPLTMLGRFVFSFRVLRSPLNAALKRTM